MKKAERHAAIAGMDDIEEPGDDVARVQHGDARLDDPLCEPVEREDGAGYSQRLQRRMAMLVAVCD